MRRFISLTVLFVIAASADPGEALHDCVLETRHGAILSYRCPPREYTPSPAFAHVDRLLPRQVAAAARYAYAELARAAAHRHGLDPRLVETVINVESGWYRWAVSSKGAQGLMQLMPKTASRLGVANPFDPYENIDGGVRHLRDLLDEFRGDLPLVLAAYHAGAEAVHTHRGVPPYPETQAYVRRVLALYRR